MSGKGKILKRLSSSLFRTQQDKKRLTFYSFFVVCSVVPAFYHFSNLPGTEALVIAGLNLLVFAYTFDFAQLMYKSSEDPGRPTVNAMHVFLVSWFLPFIMTLAPAIEHSRHESFYSVILSQGELEKIKGIEENILEVVLIPHLLHDAIFSSLVVLVPLEFFALFFLNDNPPPTQNRQKLESAQNRILARRHALIAAGCLDVATLFFLLLVAKEKTVATMAATDSRGLLIFYLMILWLVSLISSFIAIFIAQYKDDKDDPAEDLMVSS